MFVYHRNGHHLIVLLYVDDIILTFCSFRIYSKMKKNRSLNYIIFLVFMLLVLRLVFIFLFANMLVIFCPEPTCLNVNLLRHL